VRNSLSLFRPSRLAQLAVAATVAAAVAVTGLGTAKPTVSEAATLPAGFQETVAISGLVNPTSIRFASDGRVFVGERSGMIKVFDSLSDKTPTVFADLRTQVHSFWDRGLTGMALDPAFPVRPFVYVAYTYDAAIGGTAPRWGKPGDTADNCPATIGATKNGCVVSGRLSKLTAEGDTMAGSEQVLIEDWCQQFPSHSTGDIVFGADGALYMSGGDGASFNWTDNGQVGNPCGDPAGDGGAFRAQDQRTPGDPTGLNGSIIRVDPDTGAAMPGNPQAGSADENAARTIATGVRNPYRMTARPGTDEVWFGDVGWADWEEINRITPSASMTDFGWPCREGAVASGAVGGKSYGEYAQCKKYTTGYTNPHYPMFHRSAIVAGDGCNNTGSSSTTGLAFYNGGNYPAQYDGALFFADYSRRCIYAMPKGANGLPDPNKRHVFVQAAAYPVDLEIGPNGDLFYVDITGGTIRRVRYYNGNQPPTALAKATPPNGPAPLTTTLDGTGSADPEKGELRYDWDLNSDGAYDDATGATVEHTFTEEGSFPVGLQVTDPQGSIATDTIIVTAGNSPPVPIIDTPKVGATWAVGDSVQFSGHASDADEGTLPGTSLTWSLTIEHCATTNIESCHAHPISEWEGTDTASFDAPDHEYPSHLVLKLTATDADGATSTVERELYPRTVKANARVNWAGLQLRLDGAVMPNGGETVIAGSTHTISAPETQVVGGVTYQFAGWSDGGEATHNIVANGVAPLATYRVTTNMKASVSAGSIKKGQAVTVTGQLLRGNVAVGGLTVQVYSRPSWSNGAWVLAGNLKTAADGKAKLTQKPAKNTEYQFRFTGSGGHLASQSPIVRMSVR
jgi:glucose/arabinose dehydrogenase